MTVRPHKVPPGSRLIAAAFMASVFIYLIFAPITGAGETGSAARLNLDHAFQSAAIPAAAPRALTPELILTRKSISDLQLSPDGGKLAMVLSEPVMGSETRRNIWIYDLSSRKLRQFTASTKPDGQPRWSPDGRTLAFISARGDSNQVYRIDPDGGEALALTEAKTAVSSFEWSPDGKRIAFETAAPKTDEEEKKEKDKDDARVVGREEKNSLLQVIDIASKSIQMLAQGAWHFSEYVWTPDGSGLVITATDDPRRELFSDKIYRLDAGDGKMTLIASPSGPFGNLKVSPDGKTLAYIGSRTDGPEAHDLFVQSLDSGPARNLTAKSIDRPIGQFAWEDDTHLFLLAATGFGNAFYEVGLDGKAKRSGWTPDLPVRSFAKGKSGLAFVGEGAVQAPELWVSTAPGLAEKISGFNKDWDSVKLVKPEIVRYASFDKVEIEAALLKPEGVPPDARLPLIVLVHGGPTGAWTDRFDSWGQLLVARGFAVLSPNIRGSTNYGHDFMVMNRRDWGGGDFKDVMAGVDWLIKRGAADPDRVGLGGWSYGGYMAAWAVTQTTRFKASVSGAPMTDLAFEYGTEEASINAYDTWFMGTPYENLPLFIERSPVTYVRRVKTPTLLLCGENDATDPVEQCTQFHRGLRRYGVETEFVVYPREGHGIREEKHAIDVLNRVVGWFEKHLSIEKTH